MTEIAEPSFALALFRQAGSWSSRNGSTNRAVEA
jgi:hypothetical protein